MGKRDRYRDHPDPEYQGWGRTYRSFPGVAECARLILQHKATGAWADIVVHELAANARDNLAELIQAFHEHASDRFGIYVMMALEIAALPESVEFLSSVLQRGDARFVPYARRALQAIDTQKSRSELRRFG